MAKDFSTMEDSNRSSNPNIHEVCNASRRVLLHGSAAAALAPWLSPAARLASLGALAATGACATGAGGPLIGFAAIPISTADKVTVPTGYTATPFMPWGEPVGLAGAMPMFKEDGSNTAAEQALQMGMHHDGMHYFPLDGNQRGLLVMNHEYVDDGLLHADGLTPWTAEKVRKSQAAHGISITEIEFKNGAWSPVRPSRYARRLTATTPMALAGPAAGHALTRTAADPEGRRVLGTFNNCAAGMTPWGTYLSGEENWAGYFYPAQNPSEQERRWGIRRNDWYRWHEHDERFDTVRHPQEPHRHGYIVEVDPFDPTSTPIKRTALGRAAHEGAWVAVTKDGRAVVYSGEDSRFEYIYRFVSRDRIAPGGGKANAQLLDHGTLYVARFDAGGKGRWMPMQAGQGPLTAAAGFADAGDVAVKTRQAADLLGGTKMDRPEWLAIDPSTRWVYCTLTNNSQRGEAGKPNVDASNPRANNTMGSIIRWREEGDYDGNSFEWNHLALAGDPANPRAEAKGNIQGDIYACPDGVTVDARGVLWIQTDIGPTALNKGETLGVGNNQMLACDPRTGQTRRFLTGPVNCEITGCAFTPDGCTMFVNIQHPGESPSERSDSAAPRRFSNWPDFKPQGRPRSATVVIRRDDGGVIGA
jgi:uncharacterized protein